MREQDNRGEDVGGIAEQAGRVTLSAEGGGVGGRQPGDSGNQEDQNIGNGTAVERLETIVNFFKLKGGSIFSGPFRPHFSQLSDRRIKGREIIICITGFEVFV